MGTYKRERAMGVVNLPSKKRNCARWSVVIVSLVCLFDFSVALDLLLDTISDRIVVGRVVL